MATELWLVRRMGHLVPANSQSAELLSRVPNDKWVLASIRQPRNVRHHRKYFALMQAVFPHQTMYPTFKKFRSKLEEGLGHGEYHVDGRGEQYFENESISFAKMDQTEFEEFYDRAVTFILERILPLVSRDDLEREVLEILEGRPAA